MHRRHVRRTHGISEYLAGVSAQLKQFLLLVVLGGDALCGNGRYGVARQVLADPIPAG